MKVILKFVEFDDETGESNSNDADDYCKYHKDYVNLKL